MFHLKISLLTLGLLTVVLSLSGCANYLIAMQVIGAPNRSILGSTLDEQFQQINDATDELIRLTGIERKSVILPSNGISISYLEVPAADYGYVFKTTPMKGENDVVRWIHTHWRWKDRQCFTPDPGITQNRTLLMLHGWGRDSRSLISYAVYFAQFGVRVIVPDLRGHGKSNGEYLSFGAFESDDIKEFANVIALQNFDVFGFSLGAAVAIHMAANDERVNRVVAVAPMHSIKETIPKFGARSRPWVASLLEGREDKIVDAAISLTDYDLNTTSDTLLASKNLNVPILLVYGERDQMSDEALSDRLMKNIPGEKYQAEITEMRHTHVLQHQSVLAEVVASWLEIGNPNSRNADIENTPHSMIEDGCRFEEFQL